MKEKTFNIKMPIDVQYILGKLKRNDFKAYIVGGCVRDNIMGREPHDYDITTDCDPQTVINIFKEKGFNVIETGLKHGTVTVMINNVGYEITTFRTDGDYSDHRHSDEVIFVKDLKEDLSRRDFTCNAMAYNDDEGLIDPFNGMESIKKKELKCVGNPIDRFEEDALRMLRAARFRAQLDFIFDTDLMVAISEKAETLKFVSKERIHDELCKILMSDIPSTGINVIAFLGLVPYVIPQLEKCIGFRQNNIHHDKTVYDHIMAVLEASPAKIEIRLAALLHDIGKPECYSVGEDGQGHFYEHHLASARMSREILTDLKFDNETIDKVYTLVREHMSRYDNLRVASTKKFINRVGIENLDDLFELQIADIKGSSPQFQDFSNVESLKIECYRIINEKQPLTVKDLAINGYDLIAIGYKPGKIMGEKLKELLEFILEEKEPNDKDRLLELSKIGEII